MTGSADEFDVLVTGVAGFIGASLVHRLVARGLRVVAFDVSPFHRLADLEGSSALKLVVGDVRDRELVERWVMGAGRVVHLAAVVGVARYMSDPAHVLDVNLRGTMNVLRACHERGKPVLYASTSEVYGLNRERLSETSDRSYGSYLSPRWSYAISKSAGEQYAQALAFAGLRHTTTRFFNVYGPGLDKPGEGRVISRFLGLIRDQRPLTLIDGGDYVRAFCFVDEAVAATETLALRVGSDDRVTGRAFNIGRDEPVTMRQLAQRMIALTAHTAGTVEISGDALHGANFEEIPHRVPDLTAIREVIGFEAQIDLNEGLRRTLSHYGLLAAGR